MLHRLLTVTSQHNEAKNIVTDGSSNNIKSEDELKSYAEEIKNKLISDGMFSLKFDDGTLTVTYSSDRNMINDCYRSSVYFVKYSHIYGPRSQFVFMGYVITDIDSAVDSFIKRSLSDPRTSASTPRVMIPRLRKTESCLIEQL